ncbi:hypothetical protein F9L07_27260 [Pimelobacter simplex]|uniref:Uncharacterized protein n=1 Tax=Nocardioides simplex TaxID=2045 RepID=A0A7J5DRC1_NOCSI|nr:hypothetical protein [Pimelobacter simplex]KAB2807191.1 hypothetical protein F9L07_27260 [Pimelobacter simplex]
MVRRVGYVVDTWGLPRGAEVDACRFALSLFSDTALVFETDIPLDMQVDWTPPVRSAAHRLLTPAKHRSGESDSYRRSGIVAADSRADWAFVTFAPYAYNASVWSEDPIPLVSLAEEGTSLVVRLEPHEHSDLANFVGQDRVVPRNEWEKRRRRVLKARRSRT